MVKSNTYRLKVLEPQDALKPDVPVNRNIFVAGRRTSVRFEPVMWDALKEICRRERLSLHQVATRIAEEKSPQTSLTAAIRLFIFVYYRTAATDDGHRRAGHSVEMMPDAANVRTGTFRL